MAKVMATKSYGGLTLGDRMQESAVRRAAIDAYLLVDDAWAAGLASDGDLIASANEWIGANMPAVNRESARRLEGDGTPSVADVRYKAYLARCEAIHQRYGEQMHTAVMDLARFSSEQKHDGGYLLSIRESAFRLMVLYHDYFTEYANERSL